MKIIVGFIVFLILIGCSSTYTTKDFSSKEKFYEDFNKSVENKNVKVTLMNDSSFNSRENTRIANDTLYFMSNLQAEKKIPLSEIQSIKHNYNTSSLEDNVKILLKNGEKYRSRNIKILSDSLLQFTMNKAIEKYLPLIEVKSVSYKNRWLGIPGRLLIGAAAGYVLGIYIGSSFNGKTQSGYNKSTYFYGLGAPVGALVGGIIGFITGYNYIYQFNP